MSTSATTTTATIEELQQRCIELEQQLVATNQQLAATNEQLVATNEQLVATNEQLAEVNAKLRWYEELGDNRMVMSESREIPASLTTRVAPSVSPVKKSNIASGRFSCTALKKKQASLTICHCETEPE
jgi:chromosome segregation ATPase